MSCFPIGLVQNPVLAATNIVIDIDIDIGIGIGIAMDIVITAIITGSQVRLGQLLCPTKESQKLAMSNDRRKRCLL